MNLKKQIRKILKEEYILPPNVRRRLTKYSEDDVIHYLKKFIMRYYLMYPNTEDLVKKVCDDTSYEILESALVDLQQDESNEEILKHYSKTLSNNYKDFILNFINYTFKNDDNNMYIFYKHSEVHGGNGFSESIDGWNKFLTKYGSWFPDLDWNKIKEKLTHLPIRRELMIKKPGEKNNNMGYYFSISSIKIN
jgi:hypothetical protein